MITPEEIGKWSTVSDDDARKIFEERRDKAVDAGTPPGLADRIPERRGSPGGARPHRVGTVVRRSRQGARAQPGRHRSRHRHEIRHHRSRDCRRRVFAGADDVSQPVQGRFGTALVKVGKIEPGIQADLRKRRARPEARDRRRARPRPGREPSRQDGRRARRRRQRRRSRPEARPDRRHHRCRRPLRPRAERPAGRRHPAGPRRGHAGFRQRRRRRQRSDPVRRRLCLVRRARHHAVARTQHRRGQGPGRGALARRPDHQPAAHQGDRDGPEAQPGRQARRRSRQPRTEGRYRGAVSSATPPCRACRPA